MVRQSLERRMLDALLDKETVGYGTIYDMVGAQSKTKRLAARIALGRLIKGGYIHGRLSSYNNEARNMTFSYTITEKGREETKSEIDHTFDDVPKQKTLDWIAASVLSRVEAREKITPQEIYKTTADGKTPVKIYRWKIYDLILDRMLYSSIQVNSAVSDETFDQMELELSKRGSEALKHYIEVSR